MLEAEAQQTPIILTEGIKRGKGEGVKAEKQVIPLIKAAPEDLFFNEKGDNMEWLRKWHHCDIQENRQLQKYQ